MSMIRMPPSVGDNDLCDGLAPGSATPFGTCSTYEVGATSLPTGPTTDKLFENESYGATEL